VLVTHSFLRSLATLDLAESKVGRLSPPAIAAAAEAAAGSEVAAAADAQGEAAVAAEAEPAAQP
jgi:hypothetical protein